MNIINLSKIKISKRFSNSKVRSEKILNAILYIKAHGKIDKPIVLNNGILVDNYARYLAAKIEEMHEVPYVELQKMSYIVGKFKNNNKEYTWKNDRNVHVEVGDNVVVEVQKKNGKIKRAVVVVVDTFLSDDLKLYNKHKSVIKKINNKVIHKGE